jgi:YVTN family beta-propeller protein
MNMTRRTVLGAAALAAVVTLTVALTVWAQTPATAPAAAELKVIKFIPLGGEGRWDYLTVDADARHIYVARETRIMVVDADSGKLIGEVPDVNGAHGIAITPDGKTGFATAGKDGAVVVFDTKTLKQTQKIKAGSKPDAILYDGFSKKVYVFNHGDGTITIIDPAALDKAPATLEVGGTLEYGVTDNAGHVYVNVEDKSETVAIDTKEQKVTDHWKLAPGEEPTGLAIDPEHKRLFVGCGNQKMIILDAESGKVQGDVAIGKGVDGVAFDAKLGLAMSANGGGRDKDGEGTITAVRIAKPASPPTRQIGTFVVAQALKTVKGARTIADDPKTNQVYLPCMMPGEKPGDEPKFGLLVVGTETSTTTQPKRNIPGVGHGRIEG